MVSCILIETQVDWNIFAQRLQRFAFHNSFTVETVRGSDYKDKKSCGDKGTIGKPCSKSRLGTVTTSHIMYNLIHKM